MSEQDTASETRQTGGPTVSEETSRALVARLLRDYLRPHIGRIGLSFLFMAVVAVSTAAFTQLMKPIIDDIFVNRREEMLVPIAVACLAVFAVKGLAAYGQTVMMSFVGHRIVADIQLRLYRQLIGADLAFFNRVSPGELIARFINDINLLRNGVSAALVGIGRDTLTTAALLGVMFYEDWLLASVAFLAFPSAMLPIIRVGQRMRRVSGRTQAAVSRLTTLLDETFQGVRHVKAYAMEGYETERASQAVDTVFALNYKAARVRSALQPIMEILGGLAIVAVILYGGHQVIVEDRTAGSFFAFITALLLAYEPLKRLAKLNANLQEGLAAASRVFGLLDHNPEVRNSPQATAIEVRGGEIRFGRVNFAYDTRSPALHDVSFEIPAGKVAALVGPSGAGKSTILNLIPRFYDVTDGAVTIDGRDLREVTLESLRRHVALVSQEILLFDDSIRSNIAYGRPEASDAEIAAAATMAGADEFIAQLPQGYDTGVGPRGVSLSGGQRQRIAIARAMLKNAPILLLDEATSSLDAESERHVQDALKHLMTGRTTLIVAHRLSTVIDADIIFVVEDGRIVESGTHAELLARGRAYARLHALQFAEEQAAVGVPDAARDSGAGDSGAGDARARA